MAQRVQIYPEPELLEALEKEAEEKKVTVTTLVTVILKDHYGLVEKKGSYTAAEADVLREVLAYGKAHAGMEFTLREASKTFNLIEGRAHKAVAGHIWNSMVGKGEYAGFRQLFADAENTKPKRSSGTNSAVYVYEDDQH